MLSKWKFWKKLDVVCSSGIGKNNIRFINGKQMTAKSGLANHGPGALDYVACLNNNSYLGYADWLMLTGLC